MKMWKLTVCLVALIVAALGNHGGHPHYQFHQDMMMCKQEFKYEGMFFPDEWPLTNQTSCILACLLKKKQIMRPNNTFNLTRALETTTMWNKTHDHFNRTMPPPSGRPPMNPQDRRGPVPFPPNHMHSNMTHEEFMNKTRIMFTNCIKGNEVATSDSCGAAMKMASCFHDQKIKLGLPMMKSLMPSPPSSTRKP